MEIWLSVLVVLLLGGHRCVVSGLFGFPTNLYTEKDDVTLLNRTNFKPTILNKENAWIVQFYNSWCGHCQKFAPTWISLARSVKGWNKVISVAAIDCAPEANLQICKNYSVTAFPTIRLFSPRTVEGNTGKVFQSRVMDVVSIEQAMIDFVTSQTPSPPLSWPDLLPIKYDRSITLRRKDMNSLWKDTLSTISYVAIMVEDKSSTYLGRQVILDSLYLSKHIRIVRAIRDRSSLIDSFKGLKTPFVIIANRNGNIATYTDVDNSRSGFVQHLEEFAKNHTDWKEGDDAIEAAIVQKPIDKRIGDIGGASTSESALVSDINYVDKVYMQDLENVLYYVLLQEVALQNNISGTKLVALKEFIDVLDKYLPMSEAMKDFLQEFNKWLQQQRQITSDALLKQLRGIQHSLSFTLKMRDWIGCRGSLPYLRGYPCGLWVAFHTLTVSLYKTNDKDPQRCLRAIRGYVINFFGCAECAQHFAKMSADLSTEIVDNEQSVLWLWQAHNRVNQRLKGDASEDPSHPKIQFPSETLCSNCRISGDDVNQWDLPAVLQFLLSHYSEESIVNLDDLSVGDNRDSAESIRKRETKQQLSRTIQNSDVIVESFVLTRWGFGRADISLCILLYVSSILLLILCYFYILTRRRSLLSSLKKRTLNYFV